MLMQSLCNATKISFIRISKAMNQNHKLNYFTCNLYILDLLIYCYNSFFSSFNDPISSTPKFMRNCIKRVINSYLLTDSKVYLLFLMCKSLSKSYKHIPTRCSCHYFWAYSNTYWFFISRSKKLFSTISINKHKKTTYLIFSYYLFAPTLLHDYIAK